MNGRANRSYLLTERPRTRGGRIERLRIVHGISQTVLAGRASELAGIIPPLTKSFISLLEADRTQPAVPTLRGLALALGCTMDYLEDGVEFGDPQRAPLIEARVVVEDVPAKAITLNPHVTVHVRRRKKVALLVRRKLPGGKWEEQVRKVSPEAARRLLGAAGAGGAPGEGSTHVDAGRG